MLVRRENTLTGMSRTAWSSGTPTKAVKSLNGQRDHGDQAEQAEDRALDDLHRVLTVHARQVSHGQRGDVPDEAVDPGEVMRRRGGRSADPVAARWAKSSVRAQLVTAPLTAHDKGL